MAEAALDGRGVKKLEPLLSRRGGTPKILEGMRIAVDCMGGDHGPEVVVKGVKLALDRYSAIEGLYLVGKEDEVRHCMAKAHLKDSRVEVVHASEVLLMTDKATDGLRKKKDCSMFRAVDLLKEGRAQGLVSQGNTGGLVAISTVRLRALEGVDRPALAAIMPTLKGAGILVDVGANPECKPFHLAQFAIMGEIYSHAIFGKERPKVGVLSNGSEETKGTELTREAVQLIRKLDLNFVGYVEGGDFFNGEVDVAVCDGFVGNLVLKGCESLAKVISRLLKDEVKAHPVRMLGGLLAQGAFKTLKEKMDPDEYGGAPLLGLNGNVIKSHGSSREAAIMNAVRVAMETIKQEVNGRIMQEVSKSQALFGAVAA
jgi:glycerol-3-phosphate acyltransferase PlsX